MRYGIYLPNYGILGDARRLAKLAQEAEAAGWDGFFLWDHIVANHEATGKTLDVVDPWLALTAVALQTETIRIGTTVTPLPRRRPVKLARETVTLDRLSGGRLILGVGIGVGDSEWGELGEETDLRKRGQMLDEALDVLAGLWSGKPFSYSGKHYQIIDAHFLPTPIQQPRIPIWVGGFWPNKAPFRRMAKWDGMFPILNDAGTDETVQYREAVDYVLQHRTAKDTPFDIIKMSVSPANNPTEARQRIQPAIDAGATWWLELLIPEIYGASLETKEGYDAIHQRVLAGPPQI